jgi:hypothetical protein
VQVKLRTGNRQRPSGPAGAHGGAPGMPMTIRKDRLAATFDLPRRPTSKKPAYFGNKLRTKVKKPAFFAMKSWSDHIRIV